MTAPLRDEEKIFQEIERLIDRRSILSHSLDGLHKQRDLESRSDERLRLKQRIEEAESEVKHVASMLQEKMPNDYPQLQKRVWINHAHKYKQNGNYPEALDKWKQIISIYPEDVQAQESIVALEELTEWKKQKSVLINQLSRYFSEIGSTLYTQVIKDLNNITDPESDPLRVDLIRNFVDNNQPMGVEAFKLTWESLTVQNNEEDGKFTPEYYNRLARRINTGEMIIVLGSGVPQAYNLHAPDEKWFANKLAARSNLTEYQDRLPTVAEFYECRADLGRNTLLRRLHREMPDKNAGGTINFYQTLAKSSRPLILISCAYDNLLEQAFKKQGKRYVEILSIVSNDSAEPVGNVLLRYSDRGTGQNRRVSYSKDDISQLNLLEQGYSLIYKIRGCCSEKTDDSKAGAARLAALTLLERDYFNFARYAERIIPGLISSEFRTRDFMFIGLRPKHWEERLMVKAILDQCNSEHRKRMFIGSCEGDFEKAYWHSRSVQDQHISIQELDICLESTGSNIA